MQRYAAHHADHVTAPPIILEGLRSPGQPLDRAARAFFEPRFGHNLAQVRVHADASAGANARAIDAHAFTLGQDIFFAPGLYNPSSEAGRRLLAHELAHTIQQQGASHAVQRERSIDSPGSPLEQEADRAADAVLSGVPASIAGSLPALTPQLKGEPEDREVRVRPVPGGRIEIVRTLEERGCKRQSKPEETPAGQELFFDREAAAFGIRYHYCKDKTGVDVESAGRYGQLRDKARQLLQNLGTGAGGTDLLTQISEAAKQARLRADVSLVLTVSGVLRAEVRGATEQGLPKTPREYDVEGLLRLTPRGWSLEVGGQYRHVADELGGIAVDSLQFTPRFEAGPVQIGAAVERREQRAGGGAPAVTTTVRGSVSVRTGERTGITFSGSSEGGGSFFVTFGTVERIPQVERFDCAVCVCPPPLPHYSCTKITEAHPGPVVQTAGHELVELHFEYDSTAPADPKLYPDQIEGIARFANQGYAVKRIEGYASPEASVKYNLDLAQRRADKVLSDIRLQSPQASLPRAEGVGELLGESPAGGEARNRELIRVISERLASLSEDEQLKLLGIDPATATQAVREDARRRIEAFTSGKRLTERARWERIFPFLRRVDVTLDRPEIPGPMVPEGREATNCDPETLRWAGQNFPPLPEEKRLPALLGIC